MVSGETERDGGTQSWREVTDMIETRVVRVVVAGAVVVLPGVVVWWVVTTEWRLLESETAGACAGGRAVRVAERWVLRPVVAHMSA